MNKRNGGLDILRVLCIFLIVIGHMQSESFVTNIHFSDGMIDFVLENIVGNGERLAINCFVMISAWFLADKDFSGKRFIHTWLMVFILNVAVTILAISCKVSPLFSIYAAQALFPITGRPQWYMCEYLLLLLTSPFINKMLNSIDRRQHKTLIEIGFTFIVLIETVLIVPVSFSTPLYSEYVWFAFLYISTAYIKKYPGSCINVIPLKVWMILALMCYGLIVILVIAGDCTDNLIVRSAAAHFAGDCAALPGMLCSLALFQFFRKSNIEKTNSIVSLIAKNTGYIYIIHSVPVLWRYKSFMIWDNIFQLKYWYNHGLLIIAMFVIAIIVIMTGCFAGTLCDKILIPDIMKRKPIAGIVKRLDQLYSR